MAKTNTDTQPRPPTIYERLIAVMEAVKHVTKDLNVDNKYRAVSHDSVTNLVRGALIENGIYVHHRVTHFEEQALEVTRGRGSSAYQTTVYRATTWVDVIFINVDNPSEQVVTSMVGTGEDPGDKAVGKAISYACKYGLLKGLMLYTGEDSDQEGSQEGRASSGGRPKGNPNPNPDPNPTGPTSDEIEAAKKKTKEIAIRLAEVHKPLADAMWRKRVSDLDVWRQAIVMASDIYENAGTGAAALIDGALSEWDGSGGTIIQALNRALDASKAF